MWARGASAPESAVRVMNSLIHHRGPDSDGFWSGNDGALCLGHARLAIVDLSEHGHQPMVSRSDRFVIVFNGEIYNHQELRKSLAGEFKWRGHSDTEVLLEAIDRWGLKAALCHAVGMFALGLWDRQDATLTLARDRMGEKPLYYGVGRMGIGFASELKALKQCPGMDLSYDMDALQDFVQVGYIGCPRSAFRGISKVPSGSILSFKAPDDSGRLEEYWTMPMPPARRSVPVTPAADQERLDRLETLLEQSVRLQMLADVPLGAFLSGGIDSSLIVALMQRCSAKRVLTFTMGFEHQDLDESRYARKVAEHLGTLHTELLVSPQDVLNVIPNLAAVYDEPFADSSQVPTLLLSKLTREHVTVALSGDAGDELFGGYNRYLAAVRLEPLLRSLPLSVRRAAAWVIQCIPSGSWDHFARAMRASPWPRMPPALGEKMFRLSRFLSSQDGLDAYRSTVSQWFDDRMIPVSKSLTQISLPECPGRGLPEQMMWWDMHSYLPDDILVKVDRAAMAHSLETRIPFLDRRIIEFALETPLHFKIRNGETKWMLRQLLKRYVPRKLFERPKQGFSLPLDDWLRGPLRDWAEDLLSSKKLQIFEAWQPAKVRQTWKEHLSGKRNHQRALWTILMLQSWLQLQGSTR